MVEGCLVGIAFGIAQYIGEREHIALVVIGVGGHIAIGIRALHHIVIVIIFKTRLDATAKSHLLYHTPLLVPAIIGILVLGCSIVDKDRLVALIADGLVGNIRLHSAHHATVIIGYQRLVSIGIRDFIDTVLLVIAIERAEAHGIGALLQAMQTVVLVGDASLVERSRCTGHHPVGIS